MVGNVALDVVIGLVFIYLLYSLYATVIMEIVSSFLGLRARNLCYVLRRMLMNEKTDLTKTQTLFARLLTTFSRIFGRSILLKDDYLFKEFFKQPAINYINSGGLGNSPSYLSAENFSKALIDTITADIRLKFPEMPMLACIEMGLNDPAKFRDIPKDNQIDALNRDRIQSLLLEANNDLVAFKILLEKWYTQMGIEDPAEAKKKQTNALKARTTRDHIQSLLLDANNDLIKFKILLENWYNDTMQMSSEWFKQTTQFFLMIIGFILALSFNVDTLAIIKKLSKDETARTQLANMAVEFTKSNPKLLDNINQPTVPDTIVKESVETLNKRLDSLTAIKETLQEDIADARNILASDWNIPDSLEYYTESAAKAVKNSDKVPVVFDKSKLELSFLGKIWNLLSSNRKPDNVIIFIDKKLDKDALLSAISCKKGNQLFVNSFCYKWNHVFSWRYFWGYFLTVVALSLGAPFWFDLLNKIVKLRTAKVVSSETDENSGTSGANITNRDILRRVG